MISACGYPNPNGPASKRNSFNVPHPKRPFRTHPNPISGNFEKFLDDKRPGKTWNAVRVGFLTPFEQCVLKDSEVVAKLTAIMRERLGYWL